MNLDITDLLLGLGLILVMVLCWTYYLRGVRREPETEKWYDSANGWESGVTDRDATLYMVPYGSLFFGVLGMGLLVGGTSIPEPIETVIVVPLMVAFIIAVIGLTGILGIPLP